MAVLFTSVFFAERKRKLFSLVDFNFVDRKRNKNEKNTMTQSENEIKTKKYKDTNRKRNKNEKNMMTLSKNEKNLRNQKYIRNMLF